MSVPFVNIHTHHVSTNHNLFVKNVIVDKEEALQYDYSFSAGIHPWHIHNSEKQLKWLNDLVALKNCVAIGECGLDKVCKTPLDLQLQLFEKQCELANQVKKPIVLHVVKAHFDCLRVVKQYDLQNVIVHGFNNRHTILEQLINANCYISLGEALLNEKSQAAALIKFVPLNRLFLETDDSPIEIEAVYQKASQLINISIDELKNSIYSNYKTVFDV